jgi:hypothetical protein
LRFWRPFGGVYPDKGRAQGRLGAKNFVEVVLLNILSGLYVAVQYSLLTFIKFLHLSPSGKFWVVLMDEAIFLFLGQRE